MTAAPIIFSSRPSLKNSNSTIIRFKLDGKLGLVRARIQGKRLIGKLGLVRYKESV